MWIFILLETDNQIFNFTDTAIIKVYETKEEAINKANKIMSDILETYRKDKINENKKDALYNVDFKNYGEGFRIFFRNKFNDVIKSITVVSEDFSKIENVDKNEVVIKVIPHMYIENAYDLLDPIFIYDTRNDFRIVRAKTVRQGEGCWEYLSSNKWCILDELCLLESSKDDWEEVKIQIINNIIL